MPTSQSVLIDPCILLWSADPRHLESYRGLVNLALDMPITQTGLQAPSQQLWLTDPRQTCQLVHTTCQSLLSSLSTLFDASSTAPRTRRMSTLRIGCWMIMVKWMLN